jgi:hypothetical protein
MTGKLLLVVLLVAWPTCTSASIDPDRDSLGLYFDRAGNQVRINRPLFATTNVYLVLMNASGTTDGFECTVSRAGATSLLLTDTYPNPTIDIDSSPGGYAVGAAFPFPANGNATVLCTMGIMVTTAGAVEFRIGPGSIPSMPGGLPVVTGDNVLRRCGIASGDVRLPVAIINGGSPVSVEASTFGAVKSLFR